MHTKKVGLSLALFLLFVAPMTAQVEHAPVDKHASKFGDLAMSVSKLVTTPARDAKDHDDLAAFVSVANTGKGVICASFAVTLNTTFDLRYLGFTGGTQSLHGSKIFPPAPRMNEMLPGESAEGSYVFGIRHGVDPLELIIKLTSSQYSKWSSERSIRCASNNHLRDKLVPDEIRFDIRDLPVIMLQSPPR